MHERPFGNTGVRVGEIGLGTWQLGGSDWGEVPEEQAFATMRAALESGVSFFDTADVYGLGRSETLIGRFLAAEHADVFVATKLGRWPEPGWPGNFTRENLRLHTERSLERLGVDALDLTQLHCVPTDELRRGEVFDHLRALVAEGKIRRFGASVESIDEALLCLEQPGLASLQIIFNVLRQKPIDALFAKAREEGVALIVRLPLASGVLAGTLTRETAFAASDHRSYNRDGQLFNVGETFAGLPFEKAVELAEKLEDLLPRGLSLLEMSLRWCLDHEAVSVVIPGAKRPEQVRQNAAASALEPLSDEVHARLREFYEDHVREHIRGPY